MTDSLMNSKANEALNRVDTQVAMLASAENGLERGYAYLGYLILEVAELQYWRVNYDSFYQYLQCLATKFNRGTGCIQRYFLTVRDLSDTFSRDQLEAIGITKAIELRRAKEFAIVLPPTIVEAALNSTVTVRELRKLINTTLKFPDDEPGDWFDAEMAFMATAEERATIEAAFDAARRTDPLIKDTISKSGQMKEILLRLSMEYLSTYSGAVGE